MPCRPAEGREADLSAPALLSNLREANRWPQRSAWPQISGCLVIGSLITGLAAHGFGLTQWKPQPFDIQAASIVAILFFVPSLFEELLFRGALHPAKTSMHRPVRIIAVAALFVLWHPIQFWTGIGPAWAESFVTPEFLTTVTVVAAVLGLLREFSGSIWPPVMFHWMLVCAWKLLFGGPF